MKPDIRVRHTKDRVRKAFFQLLNTNHRDRTLPNSRNQPHDLLQALSRHDRLIGKNRKRHLRGHQATMEMPASKKHRRRHGTHFFNPADQTIQVRLPHFPGRPTVLFQIVRSHLPEYRAKFWRHALYPKRAGHNPKNHGLWLWQCHAKLVAVPTR